jgi:hypothetical protein
MQRCMQAKLAHECVWPSGRRTGRMHACAMQPTTQSCSSCHTCVAMPTRTIGSSTPFPSGTVGAGSSEVALAHDKHAAARARAAIIRQPAWCVSAVSKVSKVVPWPILGTFGTWRRLQKLQGFQLDQVTPPTIEFSKIKTPPARFEGDTAAAGPPLPSPPLSRPGQQVMPTPHSQAGRHENIETCLMLCARGWAASVGGRSHIHFFLVGSHSF